jgi:hypothetical protein
MAPRTTQKGIRTDSIRKIKRKTRRKIKYGGGGVITEFSYFTDPANLVCSNPITINNAIKDMIFPIFQLSISSTDISIGDDDRDYIIEYVNHILKLSLYSYDSVNNVTKYARTGNDDYDYMYGIVHYMSIDITQQKIFVNIFDLKTDSMRVDFSLTFETGSIFLQLEDFTLGGKQIDGRIAVTLNYEDNKYDYFIILKELYMGVSIYKAFSRRIPLMLEELKGNSIMTIKPSSKTPSKTTRKTTSKTTSKTPSNTRYCDNAMSCLEKIDNFLKLSTSKLKQTIVVEEDIAGVRSYL